MKLAKNDVWDVWHNFENKKYFENKVRVRLDELQIVAYIKRTIRKALNSD